MVLNAEKCSFMRLGNNTKNEIFLFNTNFMKNCYEKKSWTYNRRQTKFQKSHNTIM